MPQYFYSKIPFLKFIFLLYWRKLLHFDMGIERIWIIKADTIWMPSNGQLNNKTKTTFDCHLDCICLAHGKCVLAQGPNLWRRVEQMAVLSELTFLFLGVFSLKEADLVELLISVCTYAFLMCLHLPLASGKCVERCLSGYGESEFLFSCLVYSHMRENRIISTQLLYNLNIKGDTFWTMNRGYECDYWLPLGIPRWASYYVWALYGSSKW